MNQHSTNVEGLSSTPVRDSRNILVRYTTALRRVLDEHRTRYGADRGGGEVLGFVIITPVVLLLIGVIIVGGRILWANEKVQHAAYEAARSASVSRTAAQANPNAHRAALDDLAARGFDCAALTVNVDTAGFLTRPGTVASVTANVSCTVSLDALAIPGIGGSRTVTKTATSPIDTYKERTR